VKKRSVVLLVLLLCFVVIAGAAQVLTGFIQAPVLSGTAPIPASSLPALGSLAASGATADVIAEQIAGSVDYQDPAVKNFVAAHTRSTGSGNTIAQVSDLWEAIHARWRYVPDPATTNQFHPAGDTIRNGLQGNCLDYAILNAAVIRYLGGTVRIVSAYNPQGEGHAYTEVYAGDSITGIMAVGDYLAARYNTTMIHWHSTTGPDGSTQYWLNLDWQAPYPGGPFFADNGTYYASSLTGTGLQYTDSGNPVR
jgi:hypothetical protein